MTSRICVKNLPKHVTEERFRNHFAEKGEVTDVKIMKTKDGRSRLFGFIGFKTAQEAKDAVEYFNKSFFDTSRIFVELAKQVGDNQLERPWSKYSKGSSAHKDEEYKQNTKKRKEEEASTKNKPIIILNNTKTPAQVVEDNKDLQQFLQLTKPRAATKFWSNEGIVVDDAENLAPEAKKQKVVEQTQLVKSRRTGGDNVFLKKTHLQFEDSDGEKEKVALADDNGSDDELYEEIPPADEVDAMEEEDPSEKQANKKELSDMDYLRSKMKTDDALQSADEEDDMEDDEEEEQKPTNKSNNKAQETKKKETTAQKPEEKNGNKTNMKDNKPTKDKDSKEPSKDNKKEGKGKDAKGKMKDDKKKFNKNDHLEDDIGRLFIRNLPFTVSEQDLTDAFSKFGDIQEIHIPTNPTTKQGKGIAFIRFVHPEHSIAAMQKMDAAIFQGRLLHVLPAKKQKEEEEEADAKKKTFKEQKEEEKKKSDGPVNWNSLFMNSNAVVDAIADRFGMTKSDILDREAKDNLAVRMALIETQIINETKKYLEAEGVCLDTLGLQGAKNIERSNTVILVKNIPYKTSIEELEKKFNPYGLIVRIVLPPARTIALVEFAHASDAKKAFHGVAYTKFKSLPMFLEWAPMKVFKAAAPKPEPEPEQVAPTVSASEIAKGVDSTQDDGVNNEEPEEDEEKEEPTMATTTTLYVKNLNFSTTDDKLKEFFSTCGTVKSVKIAKKADTENRGQWRSMGFGFVEMSKREDAVKAMKTLQGSTLDEHALQLQFSTHNNNEQKGNKRKAGGHTKESTKLLVKNVPFEATKKDIVEICKPYGQLKSVRVPKKPNNQTRGFAFVEFLTKQEAKNAMEALSNTHLLGRHLVFEYAKEETLDDLREKAKKQFDGNSSGRYFQ